MPRWSTPQPRKGAPLKGKRTRKPYAWERGLVESSVPAADRPRRCLACRVETTAGKLRRGYCAACWTS